MKKKPTTALSTSKQVQDLIALSDAKRAEGDLKEAISYLEEASKLAPEYLDIKTGIGYLLCLDNQADAGIKQLEQIIHAAPEHVPALLRLGEVYRSRNEADKAYLLLQKAVSLAPEDLSAQNTLAIILFEKGELHKALEHSKKAFTLRLKSKHRPFVAPKKSAEDFNRASTLELLWKTLTRLAQSGVHAFPAFGTLLGLVRDGDLLPFDKDLDLGLPFSEMQRARECMERNGWKTTGNPLTMNPLAFYHPETEVTIDLFGFIIRSEDSRPCTGIWRRATPKEWNWSISFSSIDMEKKKNPLGKDSWFLVNPEDWLTEVYGNWKIPDKNFDTLVAAKNLVNFSLIAEFYSYNRILGSWNQGKLQKALDLTDHAIKKSNGAPLFIEAQKKLEKELAP